MNQGPRAVLSTLAASALVACVGDIGDRDPNGVNPNGPSGGGIQTQGDPGRVTLHRLNRAEYNNTVRDLLGTTQRPADDFPTDDYGYGFDNIADVLTISPSQLELYERAAEALAKEALAIPTTAATQTFEAETLTGTVGVEAGGAWNLYSNGEVSTSVALSGPGDFVVSARVWGEQAGPDAVQAALIVGGQTLGTFDVTSTSANPEIISANVTLDQASVVVSVSFLNDFYDPNAGADRNLLVDWLRVEGPAGGGGSNPMRERIVTCDPTSGAACLREIAGGFAKRAWRRPPTEAEIDALVKLVDVAAGEGDSVEVGLELIVRAVLTSSHFIFRVELDPAPTDLAVHLLNVWELASRLSYFVWSSMPDEELFAAAEAGELEDPAKIEEQVLRMVDDPKASALVENFSGQWLYTRGLIDHLPDYATYPAYDELLRDSMRKETELFFEAFLHEDRPIEEMLTGSFSFLNDRLAEHYGLEAPATPFDLVMLDGDQRGGLLKQGAILTVTSYPTRTSPVKRGKWVLSQILCSEPPPPPPGVEGFEPEDTEAKTIKEALAQHSTDPICASCHSLMDPIGFGLEHFDGVGAWRDVDHAGFPVDATGVLPSKEAFDGATELADLIAADPRFGECVTKKLYTYALGRGPEKADVVYFKDISAGFSERGHKLKDLMVLIAQSEPFRMRHGEKAEEGGEP